MADVSQSTERVIWSRLLPILLNSIIKSLNNCGLLCKIASGRMSEVYLVDDLKTGRLPCPGQIIKNCFFNIIGIKYILNIL